MNAETSYTYDAATNPNKRFAIGFPYIQESHLDVYVDDVLADTDDWELYSTTTIEFTGTLADAAVVKIKRDTPSTSALVDFQGSGLITETDLDLNTTQLLYMIQELQDRVTTLEAV